MGEGHRIRVQWGPRSDRVEASTRQLLSAFDWLRTLPELDGAWTAVRRGTEEILPCGTAAEVARCIEVGSHPITPEPPSDPAFYRQCFYLGSFRRWRAKVTLVCGFREVAYGEQAPNSFELAVRAPLSVVAQRQAFVGLVGVYRPLWGHAGSETVPARPTANDGTPAAGFLTFLSGAFGPHSPLRSPMLVSPMGHFGTLYQAFPDPFNPASEPQRHRIRDLEQALLSTGALRPFNPASQAR